MATTAAVIAVDLVLRTVRDATIERIVLWDMNRRNALPRGGGTMDETSRSTVFELSDRLNGHIAASSVWPADEYARLCALYEKVKASLVAVMGDVAPLPADFDFGGDDDS